MASLVVSGDTSGTVTISAPLVAGSNTATLPAASGNILLDTTSGVCRAWVNFNGTGTVAIRGSFNVSSITDNGVGNYTVNFTTAMQDANYAISVTAKAVANSGNAYFVSIGEPDTGRTASAVTVAYGTTPLSEPVYVSVVVFR